MEGTAYEVQIGADTVVPVDQVVPALEVKRYRAKVLAESGLFKNGEQHDAGVEIELVEQAARRFLAAGDIEMIDLLPEEMP